MNQCPDADRLFDFAVEAAETDDLAGHLAECDSCAAEVAAMRGMVGALRPMEQPNAAAIARARAAVRAEAEARWEFDRPRLVDFAALGALGALSVAGVVLFTDTSGQAVGVPLLVYSTIGGAAAAIAEYVRATAARPMPV